MEKDDYSEETKLALGYFALQTMNFQFHFTNLSKIVVSALKKHNIVLEEEVIDDLTAQITEYTNNK